jgi:hypothetical protein
MKILHDSVSSEYRFPLSKRDIGKIKGYIPSDIWNAILYMRFGLSKKTSRAGRMVKRGRFYSIRMNFCLKQIQGNLQSHILFDDKRYIENIKRYGGKPNLKTRTIGWNLQDAKRYALYILLHEIGHAVYTERDLPGSISGGYRKGFPEEEEWCDNYSAQLVSRIQL